jgi:hypothetical protein
MILDRQEGEFHKWPFLIFQSILSIVIVFHCYSFSLSHHNISSGTELQEKLNKLKGDGYAEIIIASENKYYLELIFESPLPFKIMGWASLYEHYFLNNENSDRAYLIDSNTYKSNLGYFKNCNYQVEKFNNFIIVKCPK